MLFGCNKNETHTKWINLKNIMLSLKKPVLRGLMGFPGGSMVKNPPANAGDMDSIPGSGRSPGGGHGSPLQYPCLENPVDRGALWTSVSLTRL